MLVVAFAEQHLVVADAGGLHALLALLGDEGDSLTLLEGLEAVLLNGAEVDEEVSGAVLGGDEAVALLVVEPLDGAVLAFGGGVHFDELGCV
jgi:hypothetical protein